MTKHAFTDSDKILLILFIICFVYEIAIIIISFVMADEVKCNLLWCEFTTTFRTIDEKTIINKTTSMSISSQCYENGIEVNCSEIQESINWSEYEQLSKNERNE